LIRKIEILGEAAARVSPELRSEHPQIPWRDIIGMRNRLTHAYFDIDLGIVLSTVQAFLPSLFEDLVAIQRRTRRE